MHSSENPKSRSRSNTPSVGTPPKKQSPRPSPRQPDEEKKNQSETLHNEHKIIIDSIIDPPKKAEEPSKVPARPKNLFIVIFSYIFIIP